MTIAIYLCTEETFQENLEEMYSWYYVQGKR